MRQVNVRRKLSIAHSSHKFQHADQLTKVPEKATDQGPSCLSLVCLTPRLRCDGPRTRGRVDQLATSCASTALLASVREQTNASWSHILQSTSYFYFHVFYVLLCTRRCATSAINGHIALEHILFVVCQLITSEDFALLLRLTSSSVLWGKDMGRRKPHQCVVCSRVAAGAPNQTQLFCCDPYQLC